MRELLFLLLFPDYYEALYETIIENQELKDKIENPPVIIYYQGRSTANTYTSVN